MLHVSILAKSRKVLSRSPTLDIYSVNSVGISILSLVAIVVSLLYLIDVGAFFRRAPVGYSVFSGQSLGDSNPFTD